MSHLSRRVFVSGALMPFVTLLHAQATTVPRPELKVGDRWKIERRDQFTKILESTTEEVVTAASPTRIEMTFNGVPGVVTPDLTQLDTPLVSNDTGYEFLRFPLELGKKWDFKTNWKNKATSSTGSTALDVQVLTQEQVTVQAGKFDAIKLRAIGYMYLGGGRRNPTITYWYSPLAKRIVRLEWTDPKRDFGFIQELVEFTPGQ